MRICPPPFRTLLLSGISAACINCTGPNALLAPSIAQPDTRPARNFTSFSAALECMDGLLGKSKRGRTLISSSDIPDETNYVNVGADDMLINAVSQMNRRSQKYVFIDQALIKFGGLLDVEVQNGDEVVPQFYIRGSISQLDRDLTDDEGSGSLKPGSGRLTGSTFGPYKKLSVVSVDMHLVAFPSRRVLPGASVANSMVVVDKGFGASATGLIDLATLGISVQINRVESEGQAVRNLIEVGLIELLGRHAGVPYWTCLAETHTSAKSNGKKERKFVNSLASGHLQEAQEMLLALGYLKQPLEQDLGPRTRRAISRFQADNDILPNGILDFDLMVLLERRTKSAAIKARKIKPPQKAYKPAKTKTVSQTNQVKVPAEQRGVSCPASSPGEPCDDSYINLYDFLNRKQ